MTVAVLAVQGAFIEHEKMLSGLGVECFEIRQTAGQLLYRRRSKRCRQVAFCTFVYKYYLSTFFIF